MYTTRHTASDAAPGSLGTRTISKANLRREDAYRKLRAMVLTGEFSFGQRLGEEAIAEVLGVSRTPVREALLRLHSDRLLARYDDGGFYIAEPDLLDLRDLYELRLSLEVYAITRAEHEHLQHDEEQISQILATWHQIKMDPPPPDGSFIDLDEKFHLELCRASGNLAIAETLETINARIRPVRMYDFVSAERISVSIDEHIGITEAVGARELIRAAQLMREHIGASLEVVEERAAAAMAGMIRGRSRRRVGVQP